MSAIRLCLTDPALRAAGLVMTLQGAVACSFAPYLSTLAVNSFGFGDHGYAVLLALFSIASVSAAVIGGIRADQTAKRRRITLVAVLALALGTLLMTAAPGPWIFALTVALLIPISSITFGQVFALARLAATRYPPENRDGIMAVIRALFAFPFIVVLPLWSLVFAAGAPVTTVFPAGLLLAFAMLLGVCRLWPRDGAPLWEDRPSGRTFHAALAEMARPRIAARVIALGAVFSASTVYMAIVSLIMTPAVARGTADVALYVGLVAGLEVPFMLLIPGLTRSIPRTRLIFVGALLYSLHVALLPVLAGTAFVWLLVLPAAVGGAVTLTVPIAYLQDLLADRPGAGASLMALQRLAGDVIAASCFALGTALSGYGMVALLGVAASMAGAAALWAADHLPGVAARRRA
ncbi:MFS transporter [Rhodobacter calidifons]|uniref:MFS transporter n=1 Tax=Rhodobacter calidifons TaxID=2715277 RepID=A0ABX0G9X4_9RHOB|nr:MFS transporter [Rhodobacter calidifons]NHB78069.1 MFS transporter [Rhodobacter calidifons]